MDTRPPLPLSQVACPESMETRRLTKRDLSRYNGKDGAPTFIAYEGKVYDVSGSFLWQNGRRQAVHLAGDDLTRSLTDAPQDADVIRRFPMVGRLEAE